MIQAAELDGNSRLLVLAPHPDDETLATGRLIQMALAAGAQLRVIMVTDGDNNPWPQRWIEKRWRIDAPARGRWAVRRRAEASTALSRLGVAARDVRYFGWPDQGLTALLMRDSRGTEKLAAEILDFSPTVLAGPSMSDLHPDHNALGAMLDLALSAGPFEHCRRLNYVVHGERPERNVTRAPDSDECARRKSHALQAHTSQLSLSARRMARMCRRSEWFEPTGCGPAGGDDPDPFRWRWPRVPLRIRRQRHALLLVVRAGVDVYRLELSLDCDLAGEDVEIASIDGSPLMARLRSGPDGIQLELHGEGRIDRAYAKLERLGHRLLIFDRQGWQAKGPLGASAG